MNLLRTIALASLFVASSVAQNCLTATGNEILNAQGPDVVLPQQAIGFPFPLGGNTYQHLHITDKGYCFLTNNGIPVPSIFADYSVSLPELTGQGPRICPLWTDAAGYVGNNALIKIDSSATRCTVIWESLQIFDGGASGGSLFDVQMHLYPDGEIVFEYDGRSTNGSIASQPGWQAGLVGISPGLGASTPAASNFLQPVVTAEDTVYELFQFNDDFDLQGMLVTFTPTNPGWIVTQEPNNCAMSRTYGDSCPGSNLELTTSGLPFLGTASFSFEITGVENVLPYAFLMCGDQELQPGVDLTGVGMTNCLGYTNGNLGLFDVFVWLPQGFGSRPFPIANDPSLRGLGFVLQAMTFTLSNPAGIHTSNGLIFRAGF